MTQTAFRVVERVTSLDQTICFLVFFYNVAGITLAIAGILAPILALTRHGTLQPFRDWQLTVPFPPRRHLLANGFTVPPGDVLCLKLWPVSCCIAEAGPW